MKILICDDHAVFRAGLRVALEEFGSELLEAEGAEQAFASLEANPDIELVLLDLDLPRIPGLQVLAEVRGRYPGIPVAIVSAFADADNVRSCLAHGAAGFVPKSSSTELLTSALKVILSGGVYIPPQALDASSAAKLPAARRPLTPRQVEVLRLMSRGLTNREIADILDISFATVKSHIESILDALDVSNRTEAVLAMGELGYAD